MNDMEERLMGLLDAYHRICREEAWAIHGMENHDRHGEEYIRGLKKGRDKVAQAILDTAEGYEWEKDG